MPTTGMQNIPPELWADYQQQEERKRLTEALTQMAMRPTGVPQQGGMVQARQSPLTIPLQAFQGYMAGKSRADLTQGIQGLGDKYSRLTTDAIRNYMAKSQGQPEIPIPSEDAGGVGPGRPAQPGDPRGAIVEALRRNIPGLNEVAKADLANLNRAPEKYDAGDSWILIKAGRVVGRVPKQVSPDTAARVSQQASQHNTESANNFANRQQADRHWNGLSAAQREQFRLQGVNSAADLARLYYDTGQQIGGFGLPGATPPAAPMPAPAPTPRGQGMQPSAAPAQGLRIPPEEQAQRDAFANRLKANEGVVAAGGQSAFPPTNSIIPAAAVAPGPAGQRPFPPRVQDQLAKASAEKRNEQVQSLETAPTLLKEARTILEGGISGKNRPTGSGVGAAVDWAGSLVGMNPPGSIPAARLKAIAGNLLAMMPRTPGAVSDFETRKLEEAVGQIGDASIPIARRIAALDTAEQIVSNKLMALRTNSVWQGEERRVTPPGDLQGAAAAELRRRGVR